MKATLKTTIDHIIFGSYFLEDGVNFIYEQLGVRPEYGGQHVTMGTHNKLINLGNQTYLEIIAIDPDLPKPQRARWFGLDRFTPESKPRLLTWAVRTNDIQQAMSNTKLPPSNIETLQRGIYKWNIFLPEDGQTPMEGLAPSIIQWHGDAHPALNLPFSKVTLINIHAFHPDAGELQNSLTAIGFSGNFTATTIAAADRPNLQIALKCPRGIIEFNSSDLM